MDQEAYSIQKPSNLVNLRDNEKQQKNSRQVTNQMYTKAKDFKTIIQEFSQRLKNVTNDKRLKRYNDTRIQHYSNYEPKQRKQSFPQLSEHESIKKYTFQPVYQTQNSRVIQSILQQEQNFAKKDKNNLRYNSIQDSLNELEEQSSPISTNINRQRQLLSSSKRSSQFESQIVKELFNKLENLQSKEKSQRQQIEGLSIQFQKYRLKDKSPYKQLEAFQTTKIRQQNINRLSFTEEIKPPSKNIKSENIHQIPVPPLRIKPPQQFPKYLNYFDINCIINFSNSIYVNIAFDQKQSSQSVYKYFFGKGNNSEQIKQILKMRPQWAPATSQTDPEINLLWTQHKKINYLSQLEYSTSQPNPTTLPDYPTEIRSFDALPIISDVLGQQLGKVLVIKKDYDQYSTPILSENVMKKRFLLTIDPKEIPQNKKIHNHIINGDQLGSKKVKQTLFSYLKKLLLNLRQNCQVTKFDINSIIPKTFLLPDESQEFEKYYYEDSMSKKIWILKPAENSNRGKGIKVLRDFEKIQEFMKEQSNQFVVQKYIEKPFLYQNRKFDIRCFVLITVINGKNKGYWFKQGYLRTSSKLYNLSNLDSKYIHLTNDAVQNKYAEYGRYEKGNKVSFEQFSDYLKGINSKHVFTDIFQKIKILAVQALQATIAISPKMYSPTFEIYGLDFMLDENLDPFLIEFNTNPCFEMTCPILSNVIGSLLNNVFRLVIDPLFPMVNLNPSKIKRLSQDDFLKSNLFELVYDI